MTAAYSEDDFGSISQALTKDGGYTLMNTFPQWLVFNKGYTPEGYADKVFHLHMRLQGDHNELYFRDYLNDHPETALEYESLKSELARKYRHDRDTYTEKKTNFCKGVTVIAKEDYPGRYE